MPMPGREKRWPRAALLAGAFLVLLYLYVSLSEPPLPPSGLEAKGVRSIFSIYGWGSERLDSPNAVASDKDGNIYIADTRNHRIAVFNRRGVFQSTFGKKASSPQRQLDLGQLVMPTGIAVADNGDIYVGSMQRNLISVFSANGTFKRNIQADRPIALLIAKNRLYASTPGSIWVFSLKGDLINHWGTEGRELGRFEYPNGLALDKKGSLFVSDTQNSRVQILNSKGELTAWKGTPPKNLNDPQRLFGLNMGLALDDSERVYVVDAFRHSIHVFDHEGNDLGEYGEKGEFDGRFNYPAGIAYLGDGLFAVADKWNDRVQVIRLNLPAEPAPIVERTRSALPYLLLLLLMIALVFLSWRKRRLAASERALEEALGHGQYV